MGANIGTLQGSNSQKEQINDFLQRAENTCQADCDQIIQGNTIFLDGSTVGDITFDQNASCDASCTINSALETLVTTIQDTTQGNTVSSELFGGTNIGTLQVNNDAQSIRNELEQVFENICQADVNQAIQGNLIYARNSTTGDIGFNQVGNAVASCYMANAAIADFNIKQTSDQTNANIARVSPVLAVVGGIVAIIVIIVLVVMFRSKISKGINRFSSQPRSNFSAAPAVPTRPIPTRPIPTRPIPTRPPVEVSPMITVRKPPPIPSRSLKPMTSLRTEGVTLADVGI